ncbi:MAG TPA: hypothetical protein VJU81_25470 [Methylomirabilota bacterium]|nr:hypothetical protein [Methylomirabilota bacterium]
MPLIAIALLALALAGPAGSTGITPADAQPAASGVQTARARLIGPGGALLVAAGKDVEVDAGTLTEADIPGLLALAAECAAAVPGRTEVKIVGVMGNMPIRVQVERDKGGRLEVQLRGIPIASRARLFEIAEVFLAKGAFDVRVEGPVAGRNLEARIRERVPDAAAIPTAMLPPPSPTVPAGSPVEVVGRWRSTTVPGAVLTLRPAAGGFSFDFESPHGGGLSFTRSQLRGEGTGTSNAEALALSGRVTSAEPPGAGAAGIMTLNFVLRREGNALRGTGSGPRNVPVSIEFVKDGQP